ncbi:phasin family protein [Bradyrhizobium sp. WYCCWR 13023]|uniref:Phasin family protein n=1 Tax=Bradyrhizobium zhengyangense TaxID=2911009 RepID=A0A9X1UA83_9BRAD|nr:phasin family protein [Bradyrhizobium zhengyangense]MCG2627763.1 phasin family protein [Bradyrhizobium zhengyangense]MCG2669814.1 phasin family protein [Bradyrhizobium zhengyangense]
MTDQSNGHFEIPPEMRNMAESSFKQARDAFEKLLANAEAAAGTMEERGASMRAGAKDIGARALAFAETNVQASLNYAQSLAHARDLTEVMRLHGDYVQSQMKTLAEQAGEIGQLVSRTAMDATKRH